MAQEIVRLVQLTKRELLLIYFFFLGNFQKRNSSAVTVSMGQPTFR